MFTASPWRSLVSFLTLSSGCYGNFVYGSESGAGGEAGASSDTSTRAPDGSTTWTEATTTPTNTSFGPAVLSTSSESETATGNTSEPGTTTTVEPLGAGCSVQDPSRKRTVFVTDEVFYGHLTPENWTWINGEKGAERGDTLCQCAAANAGLPGEFVAWMSDSYGSIHNFITASDPDYENWYFVDTQNVCIAESWADLTDGEIQTPLQRNERKDLLSNVSENYAWTGTFSGGKQTGFSCGNWTGTGIFATVGKWSTTNYKWSNYCSDTLAPCLCSNRNHLYCIQISHSPVPDYDTYTHCMLPHTN